MSLKLLTLIVWMSTLHTVSSKPLKNADTLSTLLGANISPNLHDKAEAIDKLLQLLSEIDLPSICDVISAQKNHQPMQTVDAIMAEAARSQAMTFIPTNLPETVDVTRPGTISALVPPENAGSRTRF